eukprot:scaffold258008_cov103-Cyclotella_meneghiniana.AAC.2
MEIYDSFTTAERRDRLEIQRKLQKRQENKLRISGASIATPGDNVLSDGYGGNNIQNDNNESSYHESNGDEMGYSNHDEEEESILGEEDYEAMNQALSSPPVAWWQMRKQWQHNKNSIPKKFLGRSTSNNDAEVAEEEEEGNTTNLDDSYTGMMNGPTVMAGGVVSHPVMLTDPQSIGYDGGSFRQNPFADEKHKNNKGKKYNRNMIMYVPKRVLYKRRLNQWAYIAGAISTILLFVFFLERRKLSHYATMDSPVSMSAFLAGEQINPQARTSIEKLQLIPISKVQRNKMHEEHLVKGGAQLRTAADSFASSSVEMHASHKYKSLRTLLVSQGITPEEEFDYPATPQAQALNWMAYQDLHPGLPFGFGHDEYAAKKLIQRYALAVTYYATNGPGWYNQINFLSEKDECEWNEISEQDGYFIGAGDCDSKGFVSALALWSNNLVGALPEELGTLSTITTFSLYDNNMRGPPPNILRKLHGLKVLYLNKNQFLGDLDYLCDLKIETMKADCGEVGGVTCSCCTGCGWNEHQVRPLRLENGKYP